MQILSDLVAFAVGSGIATALACCIGLLVERIRPIERDQPPADIALDAGLVFAHTLLLAVSQPVVALTTAALVNGAGGGLIELRSDGAWFALSFAAYLLVRDFLEYALHRAQHQIGWLWEMHSLHHSEESMNVMAGFRHFWLETILKTALFYPLLAIVFKAPASIIAPITLIYFLNHVGAHLNLRFSFGRFSLCLMNAQYHRVHHSIRPEHLNKNFADLFPFWDVLFGTAWRPGKDEFPATGLVPSDKPNGLIQALVWPLRSRRSAAVALRD